MTVSNLLDTQGKGKNLLRDVPVVLRNHFTLSILRFLRSSSVAKDRSEYGIRYEVFRSAPGRVFEARLKENNKSSKKQTVGFDNSIYEAKRVVFEALLKILLEKDYVERGQFTTPIHYDITPKGKEYLTKRQEAHDARVGALIFEENSL